MKASFLLVWRKLVRGGTLWALLAALAFVWLAAPALVRGDGTAAGDAEMFIRVAFGGGAACVFFTVLFAACSFHARERESTLLALNAVRPVPAFACVCGRWIALGLFAALALGLNALLASVCAPDAARVDCRRRFRPEMESAEKIAARLLPAFLASDRTPEEVKKASPAAVLSLLAAKEEERFEVIEKGKTGEWRFPDVSGGNPVVRVRFATSYDMRLDVAGVFTLGEYGAVVSNATRAVIEIPLARGAVSPGEPGKLLFRNDSPRNVMFRPRADVEVLVAGDSFARNLARASAVVLVWALFAAAFGLMLSSVLSKPVSVFAALVLVFTALVAPSVVRSYPDEFHAPFVDRAGLAITRASNAVFAAPASYAPVADLAAGLCVEPAGVFLAFAREGLAFPLLFLLLASWGVSRKKL